MKATSRSFSLIFQPEPEGGYTVIVPALPGCVTYGKTLEEAREMAEDAITGYIESLKKHGEDFPVSDMPPLISTIDIQLSSSPSVYV